MNQSDAQNMQSYPSPNVGPTDSGGGIPFYSTSSQPQQSSNLNSDELQLTAQLSRSVAPNMNLGPGTNAPDGHEQRRHSPSHGFEQHGLQLGSHPAHIQSPSNEANEHMGGYHHGGQDERSGKRTKVSRACDECRRKKIRCDAKGEEGQEVCGNCKRIGFVCQFTRQPMKRGPSKGYIKELADRVVRLETEGGYARPVQGNEMATAQYMSHHNAGLDPGLPEEYTSSVNAEATGRKRTYSASRDYNSPFQARPSYSGQESSRSTNQPPNPFSPSQSSPRQLLRDQGSTLGGLQPVAMWKKTPELAQRRSSSSYHSPPTDQDQTRDDFDFGYDNGVFEKYLTLIHPLYPILYTDTVKMENPLTGCPKTLKSAFHATLSVAISTLSASSLTDIEDGAARKAADLFVTAQYEFAPGESFAIDLVCIQIMILLALEAESRGPTTLGPPYTKWLSSAIYLANSIRLYDYKKVHLSNAINDYDPETDFVRRIWWTLIIMDRWHASSTSSHAMIPDEAVALYTEEPDLLNDNLYHLTRLSINAGHFAALAMPVSEAHSMSPHVAISLRIAKSELDRLVEGFPRPLVNDPSTSPLIHLSHSYILIQYYILHDDWGVSYILTQALKVLSLLSEHSEVIQSPLAHHAVALAAMVLVELSRHDKFKEEATASLSTMTNFRIATPAWDHAIKELIRKNRPSSSTDSAAASKHASLASQGLQHLAELATASTADDAKEGFDTTQSSQPEILGTLRSLVRDGYLRRFRG